MQCNTGPRKNTRKNSPILAACISWFPPQSEASDWSWMITWPGYKPLIGLGDKAQCLEIKVRSTEVNDLESGEEEASWIIRVSGSRHLDIMMTWGCHHHTLITPRDTRHTSHHCWEYMFLFLLKCHKVVPTCLMLGNPWIQLFSNGSLHNLSILWSTVFSKCWKGRGRNLKKHFHI